MSLWNPRESSPIDHQELGALKNYAMENKLHFTQTFSEKRKLPEREYREQNENLRENVQPFKRDLKKDPIVFQSSK